MFRKIRYSAAAILCIAIGISLLATCVTEDKNPGRPGKNEAPEYASFAGSAACVSCHKDVYEDHKATGHFLTTQWVTDSAIAGSLETGKNSFVFNPLSKVVMEKRNDSFFQVEYVMEKENRRASFDIVAGSGKKGQSFLSWKMNSLIQLPVTWFTPDTAWSSSPGFNPHSAVFNRVVTSRCLECHSTFFHVQSPPEKHPEQYDNKQIILGVDCERCHGPAKEHVTYHTTHPAEKEGKHIVNTAKLSRQRQLDLCALCHSGKLNKTRPSFSFQAGDDLTAFFTRPVAPPTPGGMDVHGNQLGLLSASKCFLQSEMTCQSCHDVHKKEQNQPVVFSQRCMQCHASGKSPECRLLKAEGDIIRTNCIDCHMPLLPSQSITVYREGADVPAVAKLRTHHVTIYKTEAEKTIQYLRKSAGKSL